MKFLKKTGLEMRNNSSDFGGIPTPHPGVYFHFFIIVKVLWPYAVKFKEVENSAIMRHTAARKAI